MATTILKDKAQRVHVAAFGKHPGWDDHIEEIGLTSSELVWARRVLYTDGIAGNIDSGAWDRLDDEKRLPAFRHQFFWRIGGSWLVGRMWSSKDGKGRAKYPMIVCAQIEGAAAGPAFAAILPRLEEVERKVTQTASAELVRLAIGEAQRQLEAGGGASPVGDDSALLRTLVDHPGLNPGGSPNQGFERVMYEMERELQPFRKTSTLGARSRAGGAESKAQHLRVPRCFDGIGEPARAWTALLDQVIDPATPVLTMEPMDTRFVDVLVGEPGVGHVFCVRASEKGMGLATDVPYTIDPDFALSVRSKQAQWRTGAKSPARPAPSTSQERSSEGGSSKMKWAIIGGVAVVGAVIAGVALSGGGKKDDESGEVAPKEPVANEPKNEKPKPPKDEPKNEPKTEPKTDVGAAPKVEPAAKPVVAPEAKPPEPMPKPAPKVYASGDPRKDWGAPAKLEAAQAKLEGMRSAFDDPAAEAARGVELAFREAMAKWEEFRTLDYPAKELAIVSGMKALDQKVSEVERSVDGLGAGLTQRARVVIDDAKARVATGPLADAWKKRVELVDPSIGPPAAARELDAAAQDAGAIAAELAKGVEAGPGVDEAKLRALVAQKRDDATALAAAAFAGGDTAKAKEAATGFAGWTQRVKESAALAGPLAGILAEGYGPGEQGPGGSTLEVMANRLKGAPGYEEIAPAVAGVIASAESLAEIPGATRVPGLISRVQDGAGAEVTAAFARLGELEWPTDEAGLAQAASLASNQVAGAVASVKDPARAAKVSGAVKAAATAMWLRAADRLGGTEAGLAALESAAKAFEAGTGAKVEPPAWVKANQALVGLKRAAGDEGADVVGAMDAFLAAAEGLQGPAREAVAPLVESLKAIKPIEHKPDMATLGPAAAGWRLESGDEERAVYVGPSAGGAPARVEFRAVSAAADQRAMVSTTEVSVRVAASLIPKAKEQVAKVGSVMGYTAVSDSMDQRRGPRSWIWLGAEPGNELAPSGSWIKAAPAGLAGASLGTVKAPGWDVPLQYVGAPGAMLLARAAGCRLPTVDEWKAAVAQEGGPAEGNLRDGAWKAASDAAGSPDVVTGDAYVSKPAEKEDKAPATGGNDGVVWFDRVDSGGGKVFKHLRGNVAEYVLPGMAEVEKIEKTASEGLAKERTIAAVVGGSALSPGSLKWDEPGAVKNQTAGFADVGFRLAFSMKAPAGPRVLDREKVREAMKGAKLAESGGG